MARPVKNHVELTDEEVKQLKSIQRKKGTSRMILKRCQILLDLDEKHGAKLSREQCAKSNAVCPATVANTLKKYANGGIEEAISYKRNENSNHAMRKVDGRTEARIIEIACCPPPEGHSRWTLRLLEDRCKVELETPVGKDAIRLALKKTNFDLTKTPIGVSRLRKTQNS